MRVNDSSSRPLIAGIACVLATLAFAFAPAGPVGAQSAYAEGEHYTTITPPVDRQTEGGNAEVVELFWYGCPHCYSFEPYIESWLDQKPDGVAFVRVPAVFNKRWAFHARAFYTAEALGVLDKIHRPLFEAIHERRNPMGEVSDIAALFAQHAGIDEATFMNTFNSFSVDSKVRRAAQLTRDYKLTGVPSLVVNGKHRTTASQAGGYGEMLKVAEELADN